MAGKNRRSAQTEQQIRRIFLELLEKKSLSKISVTEICRMADLDRSTFYLHFCDVYELTHHVEEVQLADIRDQIRELAERNLPGEDVMRAILEYLETNRSTFLVLMKEGSPFFWNEVRRTLQQYFREAVCRQYPEAASLPVRELEDTIEKSVLTAPVSGRVYYPGTADDGLGSVAREGENVTLHTPVCFILDESSLHIEMEEKLSSELAGRNCYALAGGEKISVEYEPPSVEEAAKERLMSRLPKTVFRLKEGSEGLKAGQYTPIVFEMEAYQDVLLVPASAVLRDPDLREDYVFVLNADGSYERRNVEAESDGVKAVIRSGLSGGEELYVPE